MKTLALVLLGTALLLPTDPARAGQVPPENAQASDPVAPSRDADLDELRRELKEQQRSLEQQRQLLEALSPAENPVKEPSLHIYGFADMGVQKIFIGQHALLQSILPTTATTFVLGNVNLYFDAQPIEHWSALVEVRLTNLPDGVDSAGNPAQPYTRTSTSVFDNTSTAVVSKIRLGGIVLERAYLQYQYNDLFSVRVGSFLTPFGIWNIDHGLPTLISLVLPEFEANELFPTQQLGVEAFGSLHHAPWEYGYFAYLSNGRTPGQVSLTENKMFGGRLFARTTRPYHMTFGLSGFSGRYSDQTRTNAGFPTLFINQEVVGYNERGFGADASLDLGNLRLRSEFAFHHTIYVPGERDSIYGPGTFVPDHNDWDIYLLAAYQLPWLGLEPFLYAENYRYPTALGEGIAYYSAGLNIHFNAVAQFKLQYSHAVFDAPATPGGFTGVVGGQDFDFVGARMVLAF